MSNSNYRTTDLYYAAFLQTFGLPLVATPREGNRIHFEFDTSLCQIEEVKAGWYSGRTHVPARDYANNIKNLKSLCHS
jgi:hypothetical protein